jgi:membrane protein
MLKRRMRHSWLRRPHGYSGRLTLLKSRNILQWTLERPASIGGLFVEAGVEWVHDNALRLSAAVSYYAVLSLAPLLVIVIRVMGIAHARQFAREQMMREISEVMGTQAAEAVRPIIESNATLAGGYSATTISTIILLFSATSVFIELQSSMNTIWDVKPKKRIRNKTRHYILSYLRARLLSLAMVFGLGFLLVSTMLLSGLLAAANQRIAHVDKWPGYFGSLAVSCAVVFVFFAGIFKFLPNVPLRWRNVWHGALIAAILFMAGRFGLAVYFKYAQINNAFGAVGSLVAVLTWIYYSSFSIFYGAEFTKVWTRRNEPSRDEIA